MIDLHCHTKNSDGTWKVLEILKKAEETIWISYQLQIMIQ